MLFSNSRQRGEGEDFTFSFCFFFKHQFLKTHSPDSAGWEKVKNRSCCQEGRVGKHPCGSQLCLL